VGCATGERAGCRRRCQCPHLPPAPCRGASHSVFVEILEVVFVLLVRVETGIVRLLLRRAVRRLVGVVFGSVIQVCLLRAWSPDPTTKVTVGPWELVFDAGRVKRPRIAQGRVRCCVWSRWRRCRRASVSPAWKARGARPPERLGGVPRARSARRAPSPCSAVRIHRIVGRLSSSANGDEMVSKNVGSASPA